MKLKILSILCSILQIIGLILIFWFAPKHQLNSVRAIPILVCIGGFASIVKFFLPDDGNALDVVSRQIAAAVGLGIIFFVIFSF